MFIISKEDLEIEQRSLKKFLKNGDGSPFVFGIFTEGNSELAVLCPWCGNLHYHGVGEGYRDADCAEEMPNSDLGYYILIRPLKNENSREKFRAKLVEAAVVESKDSRKPLIK